MEIYYFVVFYFIELENRCIFKALPLVLGEKGEAAGELFLQVADVSKMC